MTGCPGIDDVELTLNTPHAGYTKMFLWKKDGTVEPVTLENVSILTYSYSYPYLQLNLFAQNLINPDILERKTIIPDEQLRSSGNGNRAYCFQGGDCQPVQETSLLKINVRRD